MARSPLHDASRGPSAQGNGRGAHILVVEDEEMVRGILRTMLEKAGYEVTDVDEGGRAIERVEGGMEVDLLVSDLGLPGISGLELIQRLRRLHGGLPCILISGYTRGSVDSSDPIPDDVTFLSKPFRSKELYASVQELLATR